MLNRLAHCLTLLALCLFTGASWKSNVENETQVPTQAKHGLTGSYYVSTVETHNDVNPTGREWFVQVWFDPNDFQLPRIFSGPAATRVDAQVAFGTGKGFAAVAAGGRKALWAPAGYKAPAGWTAPSGQPWDHLAAVVWKGYIHFPKPGTYYLATISRGPSAVYLNKARVALNGNLGGMLVSGAFSYPKEHAQDYIQNMAGGREDLAFRARPQETYVVPVPIDAPRDLPIEVQYQGWVNGGQGIDLYWVTPDAARDANGKPVAQIVPGEVLYSEPPGPIDKPAVRSANSIISADFLYFPAQSDDYATITVRLADKDGKPVAGKRVYVSGVAGYGSADTIVQPEKVTDQNGETTAKIRATSKGAHEATLFASDVSDLVDASQVAHLTFVDASNAFFPDTYAPYYDGKAFLVEPLPVRVGRPVTIKVPLQNRLKETAEVVVSFQTNDWNIGAADWKEIGTAKSIRLKPGERTEVSATWTPEKTAGHQCFRVVVSGHLIAANRQGTSPVVATLLPATGVVYAALEPPSGETTFGNLQQNVGPVEPDYSAGCGPYFAGDLPGDLYSNPAFGWTPVIPGTADKAVQELQKLQAVLRNQLNGAPSPENPQDIQKGLAGVTGMLECAKFFAASAGYRNFPNAAAYAKGYARGNLAQDEDALKDAETRLWMCVQVWVQCTPEEQIQLTDEVYDLKKDIAALERQAQDPPDATYQRLAVAAADTTPAYINATRVSLERYLGAQEAGDHAWAAKHLSAVRLYEKRLADSLRSKADALEKKAQALPPDKPMDEATQKELAAKFSQSLQRGDSISADRLQQLRASGLSDASAKALRDDLLANKNALRFKGPRELLLGEAGRARDAANQAQQLAEMPLSVGEPGQRFSPLTQTYVVGNPHDKQETVDLLIRPISIPGDWKLSIVNAEQTQGSPQAAKAVNSATQFPVREAETGKHYVVTLPGKAQVKVASVVVPVGEIGANTTARWAIEGRIGDELIGGMVHEMNVPYIIADLKLPAVGSKEEEVGERTAAPSRGRVYVAAAAVAILLVATLVVFILRRWRPREA